MWGIWDNRNCLFSNKYPLGIKVAIPHFDGLVKAVEVKANINTNAVKVMEGVAKMIAATKAGINVQNNNVQISGAELDDILSGDGPNSNELD